MVKQRNKLVEEIINKTIRSIAVDKREKIVNERIRKE